MVHIGIDPGKSGAMAVKRDDGEVEAYVYDDAVYAAVLRGIGESGEEAVCCLERVGAMPGQGVTSMFNFGQNFGYIQGLLTACEIPYEVVRPQTWKKEFGVTKDKNTSVEVCRRLFPGVSLLRTERCTKAHDGIAEAVLMCEYARRKMGK